MVDEEKNKKLFNIIPYESKWPEYIFNLIVILGSIYLIKFHMVDPFNPPKECDGKALIFKGEPVYLKDCRKFGEGIYFIRNGNRTYMEEPSNGK